MKFYFSVLLISFFFIFPCWSQTVIDRASLFKQSIEFYKRGDFKGCTRILDNLVNEDPTRALYWFNLGNCAFMSKDFEKAASSFQKVVLTQSPLGPAAKLYEAKALSALGKKKEASSLLKELLSENLPQGILKEAREDFSSVTSESSTDERALSLYRSGDYAGAEKTLSSNGRSSLSQEDQLLLALSLVRQSKMYESERALKSLLANLQLPENERLVITDLLKKVRRNEAETYPYWLFLDLSYGSTSNAYLDGKSEGPISSMLTRGSLGFGYHFNQGKSLSEKLGYILNYENPQSAPDLASLVHTLQAPVIYERQNWFLSVMPYFQDQSWDQAEVSRKFGGTVRASFVSESLEAGLDFDSFSQSSTNINYDYLSGEGHFFKPFFGVWGKSLYTQIYGISGSDGTQDIIYTDGSMLPMTQIYQGLGLKFVWRFSSTSTLFSNLAYTQRSYLHAALPTNTNRKDNETDISAKYTYALYPKFLLYLLGEYTKNSSNMGATDVRDRNYDVSIITFGFSWDVF